MKSKLAFLLLILCSCVQPNEQQNQDTTNELMQEHGVIEIIELYKEYSGFGSERKPLLLEYLSEPDINLNCANEQNQSDECILYRRTIHKSLVNYFDYKRLLGENSIIKTDAEFLHLVAYYNQIDKDCDSMPEKTTEEKQECKDQKIATLQRMVHERIKCSELVPQEYQDFLKHARMSYVQPKASYLDHSYLCKTTGCSSDTMSYFATPKQLLKELDESMLRFSQTHMCTVDDYKNEVTKWDKEVDKLHRDFMKH